MIELPKVYHVKTSFNTVIELELIEKTRSTLVFKDRKTGILYKVVFKKTNGDRFVLNINGEDHTVLIQDDIVLVDSSQSLITSITPMIIQEPKKEKKEEAKQLVAFEPGVVTSPISGRIVDVKVKPGMAVNSGDTLLLLESMKMIIEVKSHLSGTVEEVYVTPGATVTKGDRLVKIKQS